MLAAAVCSCSKSNSEETSFKLDDQMTSQQKEARQFTPEVMWKMGRLGDFSLSPDGSEVLYSMTRYNLEDNNSSSALFIQSLDSSEPRQITQWGNHDSSPSWSADGNEIYFLSDRGGSSQLYIYSDGDVRCLSDVEGGISLYGISPDAGHIWYTTEVKVENVASEEVYKDMPLSQARIYDDLMCRHWNVWEDGSYSHIFVADFSRDGISSAKDINEGEPWDVPTAPDFDGADVTWNNAGTAIAYSARKLTGYIYAVSTNTDIFLYDLASSTTSNLTEQMPGYDKYPVFSHDDSHIAWRSMERPAHESDKDRLFVMETNGSDKRYLTHDFDYNAENLVWSDDDSEIYFISPMQATYQLCKVGVADKNVTVLTKGDHDYSAFSMVGNTIVAAKTTLSMAPELFRVDPASGSDSQLSYINSEIYNNLDMGQVQKRWITTTDGKQMLTWVILPPNFDSSKQYPALLFCEGGPQSVVSQGWSYRWNFQLMASQGYVVVAPNRRGLPSFGQEWLDQISGDYSGQNIKDYLSAIDDVAKEKWVDKEHLGCVGASYGGYSVFYLAGHHEKRFKAFIAHCGIFDFTSMYGETEELWFVNTDYGGPYWSENPVARRSYENSPHMSVTKWDTPILIFTGENDFRIPYTQSLEAFTAARALGIPARLVEFKNEAHQVFKPQNNIVWNREFFSWLDKYLN